MPLRYDELSRWSIPDATQRYTERDAILYALATGLGSDPLDPHHLAFTYEKGLKTLPGLGFVVGTPGAWFADPVTGITFNRLVNAGVSAQFHAPLPPQGEVIGRTRVKTLADRGKDKGALLVTQRQVSEAQSGRLLCEVETTYLLLADGGFGGPAPAATAAPPVLASVPDEVLDFRTLPQAALIYRLTGDANPLHVDPAYALHAGFERPILHGLCTLGMVTHRLVFARCAHDPARLKSIRGRFVKPLIPGETLRVELWGHGAEIALRARSLERDVVVLDHGFAQVDIPQGTA